MKCLRCGKEIEEGKRICENCGYDTNEQKDKRFYSVDIDPDLPKNKKIMLIDNPILALVLGFLSVLVSILIAFGERPIPLLYILIFIITFVGSFYFSLKQCKVSLKPIREFGVILDFIGLAITLYGIVSWLLEFSGILN